MAVITAGVDWIDGYLRYGHFELLLSDDELEEFKKLPKKDQIAWVQEDGELLIDDYDINDYGNILDIVIYETD